jgi:VanZ family protein
LRFHSFSEISTKLQKSKLMPVIRLFLIILILVITYLSLTPRVGVDLGNDKLGHFLAYGSLSFWTLLSYYKRTFSNSATLIMLVVIYGFLMELGQLFVPGRTFSWLDLLANTLGAVLGFFLFRILRKWVLKVLKKTGIIS